MKNITFYLSSFLFCSNLFSQHVINLKGLDYKLVDNEEVFSENELSEKIKTTLDLGSKINEEVLIILQKITKLDDEMTSEKTDFYNEYSYKSDLFNKEHLTPYNNNLALYNNKLNDFTKKSDLYNKELKTFNPNRTKGDVEKLALQFKELSDEKSELEAMNLDLEKQYNAVEVARKASSDSRIEFNKTVNIKAKEMESLRSDFTKNFKNLMIVKSYGNSYYNLLARKYSTNPTEIEKGIFEKNLWIQTVKEIENKTKKLKSTSLKVFIDESLM